MLRRLLPTLLLLPSWLVFQNNCEAQRVQFPTAAPSCSGPACGSSASGTFDPYGNPLLGSPPVDVPYNVTPQPVLPPGPPAQAQFGQPVLPPGATVGVPPPPHSGSSLFPNGLPFQYERGAYQYENSDGSFARLQRLLQQLSFEHTWLYGSGNADQLSINRTELAATFGVPIFYNPNTPLLVTPGFAFNWLQGPISPGAPGDPDLPPRVYDAYLDTAWHPQLTDWLHADLGLRTGVWSDFDVVNSDSVRFLGRGLGVLSFSPKCDLLVGVWYLDRNKVKLLPAGGVHWRPGPLWDAYLVFPNPKVRRRWINWGTSQWWTYVAGEYGGGRWTVQRLHTIDDIDYNDFRLILGFEWETQTQARGHFEIGYVWGREIIYAASNDPPVFDLEDTIMLRAGIDF